MDRGNAVTPRFPYLFVTVAVRDRSEELEALVDTGFTGSLVVPTGFIGNGTPPDGYTVWRVANGRRVRAPIYEGTVQIGDAEPLDATITVLGNQAILGREITDHFRVIFDHGERVIVEP